MTTETSPGWASRPRAALLGLLLLILMVLWWPRGRVYPVVPTAEGQKIIKLLYAACNTRDPKRLAETEKRIDSAVAAGELQPTQRTALQTVITKARTGDWAGAEADAFRFAEDQVR